MFVFKLFIITDETTFISCVDEGVATFEIALVTKGKFDT